MEEISKKNVIISVIIPAFNAEKTIESCIKSLLVQTYKAYEIIVVDDGSKDNTLSILRKLAQLDDTIRVIHQKNKGVSAARNLALKNVSAKTTHICFVDADDMVKPEFISFFVDNVENGKLIIQGFIKHYKDKSENVLYNINENLLKQLIEKGDLGHIFDKCFDIYVIRKYNICFNEQFTFSEDEAFVLDYMQYVPNLKYINVAQYEYMVPLIEKAYINDNNMSMYFYCLSRIANICRFLNLPLHEIYGNRLYRCGKQFFKASNFKRNTKHEIKYFFSDYVSSTYIIPPSFSKWHFMILLMNKFKIKDLYIKIMSEIFHK